MTFNLCLCHHWYRLLQIVVFNIIGTSTGILFTKFTVFLFLAGTLRPDLIESASELASSKADAIKTHHNDTELVRDLRRQARIIFYNTKCNIYC